MTADSDRQVEIDDEVWEWARQQSGLDDPTPFLLSILFQRMPPEARAAHMAELASKAK